MMQPCHTPLHVSGWLGTVAGRCSPGLPGPGRNTGLQKTLKVKVSSRGEGGGQLENVIGYSITANYTNIFLKDSLQ